MKLREDYVKRKKKFHGGTERTVTLCAKVLRCNRAQLNGHSYANNNVTNICWNEGKSSFFHHHAFKRFCGQLKGFLVSVEEDNYWVKS